MARLRVRSAAGKPRAKFDETKHRRAMGGRFGEKPDAPAAAPATGGRRSGSVGQAHAIFDKMHGKPRSEMLAAAQAAGINRNTASTQLYHWQRARAAREAAAAGGVPKSKAERQAIAARVLGVKPSAKPPTTEPTPAPTVPKAPAADRFTLRAGERPTAAVHRFADEMPGRPRSEVIATAVSAGVNRSTASVQYSAWLRRRAENPTAVVVTPPPAPTPPAPRFNARTQAALNRRPGRQPLTPEQRAERQRELDRINEREQAEARERVRVSRAAEDARRAASRTTPVAAPALGERKLIKDTTPDHLIPKPGTKEREFHDQLHRSASVFEDANFTAAYSPQGKLMTFTVRRASRSSDTQDYVQITRGFKNDTVEHSYFELGRDARENGAAKAFLSESVAAYKAAGYSSVKVHANIDVGGYAWLRYGFKPTGRSPTALSSGVSAKLDWDDYVRASLTPEQMAQVRRLSNEGKHGQIAAMTTPIKLPDGSSRPLGKYMYLNSNWYGSLPLKDGPAYDTFRRYAGAKS